MDEIKQDREIVAALRGVAEQRDKRLGQRPTLSPARVTVLNDFLAREFPVETALVQTVTKRDGLLDLHAGIPASAEKAIYRQFATGGPVPHGIHRGPASAGQNGWWLRFFRSSRSAAVTTCILIAVGILCFVNWGNPSRHNAENFPRTPHVDAVNVESGMTFARFNFERAELFARTASIRPFNLNTNEPASLQALFLANSTMSLVDGNDGPLGLRLDLPIRTSLTEDGLARTP
jgi:hypothetical protein